MNKTTYMLVGVLGLALVIGGYYGLKNAGTDTPIEQVEEQGKRAPYEWQFTPVPSEGDIEMPQTQVSLKIHGTYQDVGTYAGSCEEVPPGELGVIGLEAEAGEVSRVQCWFAGGGSEIGVFENGTTTAVKVAELGEGSAEEPAARGEFRTVLVF